MNGFLITCSYLATIAAFVDAIRRPALTWNAADRNRSFWIGGLVIGLLLIPVGVVLAMAYAVGVLPHMSAVDTGTSEQFLKAG